MNKLALFLLPLALLLGCGGEDGGSTDPGVNTGGATTCQKENNCVYVDGQEFKAYLKITAPEGVIGDFYAGRSTCSYSLSQGGYDCPIVCTQVNTCEMELPVYDDLEVGFVGEKYIFIPRTIEFDTIENGSTVEVDWNEEGSWALAPNGDYLDNDDGKVKQVRTWIEGEHILIDIGWPERGIVSGTTFVNEEGNLNGSIVEDLSMIQYKIVRSRRTFDSSLSRMP